MSRHARDRDREPPADPDPGSVPPTLHRHQLVAVETARRGQACLLDTGTGSGKSLAHLVPTLDPRAA
jgi:ATP-dependent helicase YprA (DUF1998 family)